MRKILCLSLALISFSLFAQEETTIEIPITKGHFIVDGSVNFSFNNNESRQDGFSSDTDSFGLFISPRAAYFVIDQLAVGINASFGYTNFDSSDGQGNENSQNSTSISGGPFARYYLKNGLFAQGSLGFGTAKNNNDFGDSRNNIFNYTLGVGYAIFIGPQVSVEPLINYRFSKSTRDNSTLENRSNSFSAGAGFTIYL